MVDLKINIDTKERVENGESFKASQRGVLTFCKNTIYLGDGYNPNLLVNSTPPLDNVIFMNIAESTEDVNILKEKTLLKNVFNNWKRFSSTSTPTGAVLNDETGLNESRQWSYNEADDSMASNVNSTRYLMLINDKKVDTYNVEVSATGQDNDDNTFAIVLAAYMENNKLYTLNAVRNLTKHAEISWSLIMNYGGNYEAPFSTNRVLANKSDIVNNYAKRIWRDGYIKIKAVRDKTNLKLYTSDTNADYDLSTLIDFTLPSTKPDILSENEYRILKKMLNEPQHMGFGNASQNIKFNLVSLANVVDTEIYDLASSATLTYDFTTKTWASAPLDYNIIPKNKIISSRNTLKMFYNDGINVHRIS